MAKSSSLSSRGIKYKLIIAVCLMSVIPILICFNYIFPSFLLGFGIKSNFVIVIAIMLGLVMLGATILKQIFDPVVKLSREATLIAKQGVPKHIDIKGEDEIGQLGQALNQLTQKIRLNMDELKNYGSKTAQINSEIQKRVHFISALLHISDVVAQGGEIDSVLTLCVEKVKDLAHSSVVFILYLEEGIFSLKAQWGLTHEAKLKATFSEHNMCLIQMLEKDIPTVIDSKNQKHSFQKFLAGFEIKHFLGVPIFSYQKPVALLGIGNALLDFTYSADDIELLSIFGKQMAIAIENNCMVERLEKLEIKDMLTGLYNEYYIRSRLDEEIKRAILYQRPCALVLAKINNFMEYQKAHGLIAAEAILKKTAACMGNLFIGDERIGRFADYQFAVIFPEKNKRQAQKIAEEMEQEVERFFKKEPDPQRNFSISAVVAENPLDGVTAQELILSAQKALDTVKT